MNLSISGQNGEIKALVLTQKEVERHLQNGYTMHVSHKYLRQIDESEKIFLCSRWKTLNNHELLRVHAQMTFTGNRFLPDSLVPRMAHWHGLSVSEYELLRLSWPKSFQKRDGCVAWQFGDQERVSWWSPFPENAEDGGDKDDGNTACCSLYLAFV